MLDTEGAKLVALRVVFVQDPIDAGSVRTAIFDDTCGNLIQLIEMVQPATNQLWTRRGIKTAVCRGRLGKSEPHFAVIVQKPPTPRSSAIPYQCIPSIPDYAAHARIMGFVSLPNWRSDIATPACSVTAGGFAMFRKEPIRCAGPS